LTSWFRADELMTELNMSEREAFQRAICENPDDDTPRLVFADWLQEHGEEERAEFIRLQIQLARRTYQPREAVQLKQREQQFLARALRWKGEVPGVDYVQFARGFVEYARFLSGADFVRASGTAPFRFVYLRGLVDLITVMKIPNIQQIECIDLSYAEIHIADVETFAASDWPNHPGQLILPYRTLLDLRTDIEARFGSWGWVAWR
jgi:uncharacterized protein (TIGR02996 family)